MPRCDQCHPCAFRIKAVNAGWTAPPAPQTVNPHAPHTPHNPHNSHDPHDPLHCHLPHTMNPPAQPDILTRLQQGITCDSPEATAAVAAELAAVLPPCAVLALRGDLGAGKTSFVRGLAQAWGIAGPITSPSFNLLNLYRGGERMLIHIDAYRLQSPEQAEGLLIDDLLEPPYCLAVEWPERFPADRLAPEPDRAATHRLQRCRLRTPID